MEEPSSQDSREDLFYTETSNIFEYTPYQVGESGLKYSLSLRFLQTDLSTSIKNLTKLLLSIITSTFMLVFDFIKFLIIYVAFVKIKLIDSTVLFESIKDKVVGALMWRRGLLFRPFVHGGVVALIVIAVVASGLFSKSDLAAQDLTLTEAALTVNSNPETIIPQDRPRSSVIEYTIVKGDTLSQLAEKFGVSIDSIKWANDLSDADSTKPGDVVNIPPVSGVVHKVKKGETITSVAKRYKAAAQAIADFPFNYIDSSLALQVGTTLFVPGGEKPAPLRVPVAGSTNSQAPVYYAASGSGLFGWPTSVHVINQYPSWWHPAVDIGASYGDGVYAVGTGRVVTATRQWYGFGWHIFIDHGNGYVTSYAHLSDIKVNVGQSVKRGQIIGAVGCTGLCTGAHLHFEVRRNGSSINPLSVF
ncbi:MAG: M23 family metallopeptidase [Candidatus Woykebacteria bacterium]